jgi:hypothetical protein
MGIQFKPPSIEESQLATLVNDPVRNNDPLLDPEQTAVLELTVPEEGASTVIMAGVENADTFGGEGASNTSALYQIVVVKFA